MMRSGLVVVAGLALGVAACGDHEDDGKRGSDINFSARDADGNAKVSATADGTTGHVSVSAPGFDVKIKLPKISLGADDFDVSGVKLYPGSRIDSINIDAADDEKHGNAAIDVRFTAPAKADKVGDWFAQRFAEKKIKIDRSKDGLAGTSAGGKEFVIELKNIKAGGSEGAIHIAG